MARLSRAGLALAGLVLLVGLCCSARADGTVRAERIALAKRSLNGGTAGQPGSCLLTVNITKAGSTSGFGTNKCAQLISDLDTLFIEATPQAPYECALSAPNVLTIKGTFATSAQISAILSAFQDIAKDTKFFRQNGLGGGDEVIIWSPCGGGVRLNEACPPPPPTLAPSNLAPPPSPPPPRMSPPPPPPVGVPPSGGCPVYIRVDKMSGIDASQCGALLADIQQLYITPEVAAGMRTPFTCQPNGPTQLVLTAVFETPESVLLLIKAMLNANKALNLVQKYGLKCGDCITATSVCCTDSVKIQPKCNNASPPVVVSSPPPVALSPVLPQPLGSPPPANSPPPVQSPAHPVYSPPPAGSPPVVPQPKASPPPRVPAHPAHPVYSPPPAGSPPVVPQPTNSPPPIIKKSPPPAGFPPVVPQPGNSPPPSSNCPVYINITTAHPGKAFNVSLCSGFVADVYRLYVNVDGSRPAMLSAFTCSLDAPNRLVLKATFATDKDVLKLIANMLSYAKAAELLNKYHLKCGDKVTATSVCCTDSIEIKPVCSAPPPATLPTTFAPPPPTPVAGSPPKQPGCPAVIKVSQPGVTYTAATCARLAALAQQMLVFGGYSYMTPYTCDSWTKNQMTVVGVLNNATDLGRFQTLLSVGIQIGNYDDVCHSPDCAGGIHINCYCY